MYTLSELDVHGKCTNPVEDSIVQRENECNPVFMKLKEGLEENTKKMKFCIAVASRWNYTCKKECTKEI